MAVSSCTGVLLVRNKQRVDSRQAAHCLCLMWFDPWLGFLISPSADTCLSCCSEQRYEVAYIYFFGLSRHLGFFLLLPEDLIINCSFLNDQRTLGAVLGHNVEAYHTFKVSFPQTPLQSLHVLCLLFAGHS